MNLKLTTELKMYLQATGAKGLDCIDLRTRTNGGLLWTRSWN